MKIYLLMDLPIIGELGEETNIIKKPVCDVCGRLELIYDKIDYQFDRWNGEELISAYNLYFVSEKLKNLLENAAVKGVEFNKIHTSKSSDFYLGKKVVKEEIPNFYHMIVTGRADGEKQWWEIAKVCEKCNDIKWMPTLAGIEANLPASLKSEEVEEVSRNVYKDSNNGNDIFLFDDPVKTPFLTQKVVDILNELALEGLELKSVDWIDKK